MKIFKLSLFIAVFLVFFACNSQYPQVVADPDGLYEIRVPDDWYPAEKIQSNFDFQMLGPLGSFASLSGWKSEKTKSLADLNAFKEMTLRNFIQGTPSAKVIEENEIVINDLHATSSILEGMVMEAVDYTYVFTLFELDDYYVATVAAVISSDYSSYKYKIQAIVKSFTAKK